MAARDSLERLIGLIAAEKNPHRLINRVASYEFLLEEARRAYHEQKRSMGISRAIELCGSYQIPYEYFQDRLRLIVHLLNLVSQEEDYYRILGVDRTADLEEIKRSFRRLSRIYHPDVNPNDPEAPERFRKIREAYEVLSTSELRERYDLHPANTPRIDEALQEKVSKTGWHHRRNLLQFGILIVLLVILSLVIDYQDLITSRYYRMKYGRAPTVAEQSVPPPAPELKVANILPENPIAAPGDEARNEDEKTPDTLQPIVVAVAEKQPGETLLEATSGVGDSPGPLEVVANVGELGTKKLPSLDGTGRGRVETSEVQHPHSTSPVEEEELIFPALGVVAPVTENTPQRKPEKPVSVPAVSEMQLVQIAPENPVAVPVTENLQQREEAVSLNHPSQMPPKVGSSLQEPAQLKTPDRDSAEEKQRRPKEAAPKPKDQKKTTVKPTPPSNPAKTATAKLAPTPKPEEAATAKLTLPPEPVKPAMAEPAPAPEPVKPAMAKSAASTPEPVKAATAKTPDKELSGADMKQRIQDFLNRYSHAYENKNPTVLLSLFEPGAVENGEPVARLLPRYRDNFQRLENVLYSIRLVGWEGSKKGLKVSGRFRLLTKLRGASPVVATGSMQLDLIHHGNDFRINRLAYDYEQSRREED